LDNSASDRFFSIRDQPVFNPLSQAQCNAYSVIEDGDLIEVAGDYGAVVPAGGDGWKFALPPNEKALSDSLTFDNAIYFASFEPQKSSSDPCQAGHSINRVYIMNVAKGIRCLAVWNVSIQTSSIRRFEPISTGRSRLAVFRPNLEFVTCVRATQSPLRITSFQGFQTLVKTSREENQDD